MKSQQQNGGNDAFDSLDTIELSYDQIVDALGLGYSAMPTPERVEELLSAFDAAPRDYPF